MHMLRLRAFEAFLCLLQIAVCFSKLPIQRALVFFVKTNARRALY